MKKVIVLIIAVTYYSLGHSQTKEFLIGDFQPGSETPQGTCHTFTEPPIDVDIPVCTQVDVAGIRADINCGSASSIICYGTTGTCYSYYRYSLAGNGPSENDPQRLIFLVKSDNEITKTDNLVYTRRADKSEFKLYNPIDMSSNTIAQALFNPGNNEPEVNGPVSYTGEFSRVVNYVTGGTCHVISCKSNPSILCYSIAIMYKQKYDQLFN
jgi:hypothetical protein